MTLKDLNNNLYLELSKVYSENETKSLVYQIFAHVLNFSRFQLSLNSSKQVKLKDEIKIKNIVHDLKEYKPIQYILGCTEFYNCKLEVSNHVLIPRPESEELIAWILKYKTWDHPNILDMGTGSGCLAIALSKHINKSVTTGLDISPEALETARQNAELNNVRINFLQHDILTEIESLEPGNFHLIVSNPPYVRESEKTHMQANVINWEPALALFVPDSDPLIFYKKIISSSYSLLAPGGYLFLEINENFPDEIRQLYLGNDFTDVEIAKDLSGRYRMAKGKKPE
ncbi:MAG: peptide chain release factor N(5)-glutamine methyltransferase [Bacteroidota bacterium]|nr:peptide chain release factor N(5)-glutamine methyltransferase [Bacteroidota bacterium]